MAISTESEVNPLVPGHTGNYGVYNDDYNYTPVDEESRKILQRRRWMKYGGLAVVLAAAAAVIGATMSSDNNNNNNNNAFGSMNPAVQTDHAFAGLLADEQGFYFPLNRQKVDQGGEHRFLRMLSASAAAFPGVDWSYDWQKNAKDGAAVGEYYRAKGMAMADYWRNKFDPTYMAAEKTDAADANAETSEADQGQDAAAPAAPWTYDWQADKDRGIAIGQHYKAIGDKISEHYREAFDPTYPGPAGRRLKSKDKKKRDQKREEMAMAVAAARNDGVVPAAGNDAAGTGWYDWQADRDRGMAIGQHYKALGEQIADHYNQEFNPMYDINQKVHTEKNWATAWMDYKARGQKIAGYYKSKYAAINKFYDDSEDAPSAADANGDAAMANAAAAAVAPSAGVNPDAAHAWGLDWQKNRDEAMTIHQDMVNKGMAIGNYYRSKYDPSYGAAAPPATGADQDAAVDSAAEQDEEAATDSTAGASQHNPDLDYPPWGQDPVADQQHGMAMGQYWKQNGKATGAQYKQKGKALGQYYADKYRTMFDPTYTPAAGGN